jgi:hypothetical protein
MKCTVRDEKYYRAVITLYGKTRRIGVSRKTFRTATQAENYADRWRARVVHFSELANQPKPEMQ